MLTIPSHRRLLEVLCTGSRQERRIENAIDVLYTENYKAWENTRMFSDLNNRHGCYVFKDKRGMILYVGETGNLYHRICERHIRGTEPVSKLFHKFIYDVDIYVLDNTLHPHHGSELAFGNRKALELILIKQLRPYKNMVKLGVFKSKPFFNYLNHFENPLSRIYWPSIQKGYFIREYGSSFKI